MKILHLLSQTILTGAEAYAVEACNEFQKQGHQTWICSDTLHLETQATVLLRPVHEQKRWTETLSVLKDLIRQNEIQIIHTHSRASAKLARKLCKSAPQLCHIHTFHGLQKPSFSKRWFNSFGDTNIFVCENVKKSLDHHGIRYSSHYKTIRNGLRLEVQPSRPKAPIKPLKIALVSRLSNLKGQRTMEVLRALMACPVAQNTEIHLLAGDYESRPENDQLLIQNWLKQAHPRFFFHGFVKDLSQRLKEFDLIIGGGRIAAEALMNQKPLWAFGESEFVGLIDENNLQEALASNFGDITPKTDPSPWNQELLSEKIHQGLQQWSQLMETSETEPIRKIAVRVQKEFHFFENIKEIMRTYQETLGRRICSKTVPILMYHKIVHQPYETPHKIYVLAQDFEKHLQFYKEQGFTTIHFKDYQKYRTGEFPASSFPKKPLIITFDDGYLNNKEIALPLLEKYGMKATVFLLANPNLKTNSWDAAANEKSFPLMSAAERLEFSQNPLIEIGSHGFAHAPLDSFLTRQERLAELVDSKKHLETEISLPISVFAYTYGRRSSDASDLAKEAGYHFAVNTDTGGLHIEDDPWSIFRISMFPQETKASLWKKTRSWYRRYYFFKRKK